jgi:hypothetical protein
MGFDTVLGCFIFFGEDDIKSIDDVGAMLASPKWINIVAL